MKTLTANQRTVLTFLEHTGDAWTVREIADARALPVSSVRTVLAALHRHGAVARIGYALAGGTTWGAHDSGWTDSTPARNPQ